MFKKAHYEWVAADIANFGSVVRNTATTNTQFVPASCLSAEIGQTKASGHPAAKELQRQDLALSKIAQVTQLSESLVQQVLQQTCKAIGHYLKTEGLPVAMDFGLTTNELLLFDNERVEFV